MAVESQNLSIGSCLPLKVVFHSGSTSTEGRLPQKVVFHQRLSSVEGRLPLIPMATLESSLEANCDRQAE